MVHREMNAIAAERKAAAETLNNLAEANCRVRTTRFRDDQVLVMINPPVDMASLDWDKVLYQGQVIKLINNQTFRASSVGTHKTSIRFQKDTVAGWIGLIIHSDHAPVCAILQNDRNGDNRFFNLDEDWTTVFVEDSDPSSDCNWAAMSLASLAYEEEDLADVFRQLQIVDGGRVSPFRQYAKNLPQQWCDCCERSTRRHRP